MRLLNDLQLSGRAMTGFVGIGIAWAAFFAQMPQIKAQIGASDALFGSLILVSALGAVLAMFSAPVAHRLLGAEAIRICLWIMVAGFCVTALAHSPLLLVVGLFIASASAGIADVLANAEVSRRETEGARSLMNLNHGIYSVAYAAAAFAVGWMRDAAFTPIGIFVSIGLVMLVLTPFMRIDATPATDDAAPKVSGGARTIVWLGGLVVFFAFLGEAASEGWSALHIERNLQGTPAQGAWGPALMAFGMGVGRLGGHLIAGRFSDIPLMICATILAGLGLCVAGLAETVPAAWAGFLLAGLGVSVVGPLAIGLVGQKVPDSARVSAIAQAAGMGYAAFFVGPVCMGYLSEWAGLSFAYLCLAALMAAVALVLIPLWSRHLHR